MCYIDYKTIIKNWPISIGDVYGVYTVIGITPNPKYPTRVAYATITFLCSTCGNISKRTYNTFRKMLRNNSDFSKCKCFSLPKNDGLKDDPLFKKIATCIYDAKWRFRKEKDFVYDPPKKIYLSLTEKEKKEIDVDNDKWVYWIYTKDNSLKYVAGNITFRKVLRTSFINKAESKISVSKQYNDKRRRLRSYLRKEEYGKEGKEIFLSYRRSKYAHRIKIGSVVGSLKIIGYIKREYITKTKQNKVVLECTKCGFKFGRLPKHLFLEKNVCCPHCLGGYRKIKNSACIKTKRERILEIMEYASVECMSDYSKYSANKDPEYFLLNSFLDREEDRCIMLDVMDVFGPTYFFSDTDMETLKWI